MRKLLALGILCLWLGWPLPSGGQTGGPRDRGTARGGIPPVARPGPPASDGKNVPVTVDADELENLQKEGLIIFTGNVVATQSSSTQYADRMEVYLDAKGASIVRTVSTGKVRIITKDCRTGTAARVEYYDAEQRVVLIGNARVWRDDNVVTGERITIYLAEDRSVVEGGKQERVKAVFYPKSGGESPKPDGGPATGGPCG